MLSEGVIEPIILGLLTALFSYAVFTVKRYIDNDNTWKIEVKKIVEEIDNREVQCVQRFASKHNIANIYKVLDEHTKSIAAMNQWLTYISKKD